MFYEIKYEPVNINGNKVDKYNIYYYDNDNVYKEYHSNDGKNGRIKQGYVLKNSSNWHGLEQSLRYSDMFAKAFTQATEKGFNLFTTTLVNGKLGHASEGALQFAFSVLGVEWTESEKTAINQILESHNFVTRI